VPKRSEPPPPAHVIVPTQGEPAAGISKPMPARAIQVMRIIAIGTPGAEPAAALADDDVEEIAEEVGIQAMVQKESREKANKHRRKSKIDEI
jgi:hypothetical protein